MEVLSDTIRILDAVNDAVMGYDPILKDRACEILLKVAFGGAEPSLAPHENDPSPVADVPGSLGRHRRGPRTFSAALQRWPPRSDRELALLGAYFLIQTTGVSAVSSRTVNALLKEHGSPIRNTSQALDANVRRAPVLLHARQGGDALPAGPKLYGLTDVGEEYIAARLEGRR